MINEPVFDRPSQQQIRQQDKQKYMQQNSAGKTSLAGCERVLISQVTTERK